VANETIERKYLPNLDTLRVLAAYFVMLYHFNWDGNDLFSEVFKYGYLGVYVFFCISGFITPLSMQWSDYKLKSWKNFLISRFFRLYPAFAVIAIIEILLYTKGGFMGYSYKLDQFTASQLISNFTWTAEFYEEKWLIPVFWTLAIEAQFIILMLVVYPLIKRSNEAFSVITRQVLRLMGLDFVALANYYGISDRQTYVALPVALVIAFLPDIHSKIMKYLGKFTYSYFLIHITFGGAACFHMRHFPEEWYFQLLKVLIAGAISFVFSWVFYYKIEKPLHNYSRKFK